MTDSPWGDDLPDAEVVERYWRWAHATAWELTSSHRALYDDVVQEGLIEGWRILQVKGGKSRVNATYLTLGMRRRMRDVTLGRAPVGGNRRPGPRTEPPHEVSLDALGDKEPWVEQEIVCDDPSPVFAALAALRAVDREYVLLRFWVGMSDVEIAAGRGATKQVVGQTWHRRIKPRLREVLVELVDYP